ncbi:hypothetical protein BDZ94DRAFT_1307632 [Collybia nuda]|uniref:Uncharacterized protein n=1 Tax=Collybia nuda TaxID=64659 RepID=A0A9P5YA57_9AGAR|nr:hypothetical protein BDZ94DRAFT_1307632 [Collybia nuda]
MGRWTQYDEDSYRLPEDVTRTGYDADTGRYLFNGVQGIPYTRYGVLRTGEGRGTHRQQRMYNLELRSDPLVLPIYPSKPPEDLPKEKSDNASKPINLPNAMRALRRVMLGSLAFSRRHPKKPSMKTHASSTSFDSKAAVEKPHDPEKCIQPVPNLPEKDTKQAGSHTRSLTEKGVATTIPHSARSSRTPRERRRASEPHTLPSSHDPKHQTKTSSSTIRQSFTGVKEKRELPQPNTRSSRISTTNTLSAQRPIDARRDSDSRQIDPAKRSTSSGVTRTGKKPAVTDTSNQTPQGKPSRSATLPTHGISKPLPSLSPTSSSFATRENPCTQYSSQALPPSSTTTRSPLRRVPRKRFTTDNSVSRTKSYPIRERSRPTQLSSNLSPNAITSPIDDTHAPYSHTSSKSRAVNLSSAPSSHEPTNEPTVASSYTPPRTLKDSPTPFPSRPQPSRRKSDVPQPSTSTKE